jgi:excisionase family DNA binding protein
MKIEEVLTLVEVALILGVCVMTVTRMIEKGVLPATNLTPYAKKRNFRVRAEDLNEFLANKPAA